MEIELIKMRETKKNHVTFVFKNLVQMYQINENDVHSEDYCKIQLLSRINWSFLFRESLLNSL